MWRYTGVIYHNYQYFFRGGARMEQTEITHNAYQTEVSDF